LPPHRSFILSQVGERRRRLRSIKGPQPAKPPKLNAVCSKCGQGFHCSKGESKRTVCHICRPLPSGTSSIRTVTGGLPTLGNRRR
jgi:hypothetical protein